MTNTRWLVAALLFPLAASMLVFVGAYHLGRWDGISWGYAEGIRVADAWEKRAKECEGPIKSRAEEMSPASSDLLTQALDERICTDCVPEFGPCRKGAPITDPRNYLLAVRRNGEWYCAPVFQKQ